VRENDGGDHEAPPHILGMIQRAARFDDVTSEVADRIVAAMRPWRIVLFGSRARGDARDDSDYDIFVEIEVGAMRPREFARQILALFPNRRWSLDLKVRPPGEIERRRDDPGTIEWDIAREGQVLYADPAASTNFMRADRVGEPSADIPESFREWIEMAERDLHLCRLLAASGADLWAHVCYSSQQAVEKYMKALLISRRVRPARTHNLLELLAALRLAGCELTGVDADCALLNRDEVDPRYPGPDLDEQDGRAALAAAERIAAAMTEHLPRVIH
jgi:uncharacterized protein